MNTEIIVSEDELLKGTYGDHGFTLEQDVTPFLEQAKRERSISDQKANMGFGRMRKVATVPDIIALELLTKYGIDLHDETIQDDKYIMRKALLILQRDYPHILSVSKI
jgi:hypothetical protein